MARRALLLALVGLLTVIPLARADGDPASDYLLTRSTFVPSDLGVSADEARRLESTVALAASRGYTVHVALIGSVYDLGSVTSLDRKPVLYARFLGEELTLVYHGRLLVVMQNGFGVSRAGKSLPAEQRLLDRLPAPGKGGANLVQAGIDGVRALAAAAGVRVPPARTTASSGGGGNTTLWVVAGAAAALFVLAVLVLLRRRRA